MEANEHALSITRWHATNLNHSTLQIGLSSMLFGILTSLVIVAIFLLLRRGMQQTSVRILLPSTILLYMSTTLYMAAEVWYTVSVGALVSGANDGLLSATYGLGGLHAFEDAVAKQSAMFTIALTLNIFLGDCIVWWRASIIWRHRIVNCLGPLLLAVTLVCGALGIYFTPRDPVLSPIFLIQDNAFADISAVLSLATNVLATSLIAYKAFEHKQFIQEHIGTGHPRTRVLRALALLVESGTIYCALLLAVFIDEVAGPQTPSGLPSSQTLLQEIDVEYVHDCFVPIVAIYPALIIVIVALDRSPIDVGFTRPDTVPGAAAAPHSHIRARGGRLNVRTTAVASSVVFCYPDNLTVGTQGGDDEVLETQRTEMVMGSTSSLV